LSESIEAHGGGDMFRVVTPQFVIECDSADELEVVLVTLFKKTALKKCSGKKPLPDKVFLLPEQMHFLSLLCRHGSIDTSRLSELGLESRREKAAFVTALIKRLRRYGISFEECISRVRKRRKNQTTIYILTPYGRQILFDLLERTEN